EMAAGSGLHDVVAAIDHEPTRQAVLRERALLADAGGGCHEAIGASVRIREYGVVTSVRGRMPSGEERGIWSLDSAGRAWPRVAESQIWPRRAERENAVREPIAAAVVPTTAPGLWVARADAIPPAFRPGR